MDNSDKDAAINILIDTIRENPGMWETRKKTVSLLFESERYEEAANMLWAAPEIPFTDTDVAFTIKMSVRATPDASKKFIDDILRRNHAKPLKHLAVARALSEVGFHMLASRFYGAAIAIDSSLTDELFEERALWFDDSGSLLEKWEEAYGYGRPVLEAGASFASNALEQPANYLAQFSAPPQQAQQENVMPAAQMPNHYAAQTAAPVTTPIASPTHRPPATAPVTSPMHRAPATAPVTSPMHRAPANAPVTSPMHRAPANAPMTSPMHRTPATTPLVSPMHRPPATAPLLTPATQAAPVQPTVLNTGVPKPVEQPGPSTRKLHFE